MKIFKFNNSEQAEQRLPYIGPLIFGILMALWLVIPKMIRFYDQTAGIVDPGIWILILLSLISFMLVAALSWWLLNRFWVSLGLPALDTMVLQFNTLALWQQLGFFWLSFALLLLAAVLCLIGIC
jgi:hypothetical protein